MQNLRSFLTDYNSKYTLLNETFQNISTKFNTTIYTKIVTESLITDNAANFLNKYNSYVDNVNSIFQKLKDIAENFDPMKFVQDDSLAMEIFSIYEDLIGTIEQQCQDQPQNAETIEEIRKQYLDKFEEV